MAHVALKPTGAKMPLVGYGLWKVPNAVCADTVYNAIKTGYRLFDGACDYGNEKEAGEGIKRAIDEGLVKREDLFITSKLWNNFHAKEHVGQLAKLQLKAWGLDYFDLFLIHFPISLKYIDPNHRYPPAWFGDDGKVYLQDTPMQETWQAMEEVVDAGLAKHIGLSNVSGSLLIDVAKYARVPISVLQVEIHPYLTQDQLVDLCGTLGIAITAYSSFGPASWIELNMDKDVSPLLVNDVITAAAKAHGKTPAQVLLRWSTQRNLAVIPKSTTTKYLQENLDCIDFNLSEAELKAISGLNANIRFNDPAEIDKRMSIFA